MLMLLMSTRRAWLKIVVRWSRSDLVGVAGLRFTDRAGAGPEPASLPEVAGMAESTIARAAHAPPLVILFIDDLLMGGLEVRTQAESDHARIGEKIRVVRRQRIPLGTEVAGRREVVLPVGRLEPRRGRRRAAGRVDRDRVVAVRDVQRPE